MHKNTLGDAANGQKNHRSLLIVPLSRRSRVGRLCYICVRSAAASAHRRAAVPLNRLAAAAANISRATKPQSKVEEGITKGIYM